MNTKNLWFKLFVPLFAMGILVGLSGIAGAATINVGALNDMTGATSDVGKDYALGIAEAVHYVNDTGGINGKQINFSSKNFTPFEKELYTTVRKFSWHGTRIFPVFLWLLFLLFSKRSRKLSPGKISSALPGKNNPCPCGSGLKFKHCCAKKNAKQ